MRRIGRFHLSALYGFVLFFSWSDSIAVGSGIGELSQHFNDPNTGFSPWIFIPESNVKEVSTAEHPGLATLWQAGQGKDVKGVLENPIRIDDYPLPWEFQLGLVPNFAAILGMGSKGQQNFAIGFRPSSFFAPYVGAMFSEPVVIATPTMSWSRAIAAW